MGRWSDSTIIDYNNLILDFSSIGLTAHYHVIEVQESNKMPFTFTKILINNDLFAVLISYKLIDIFGTRFFLNPPQ